MDEVIILIQKEVDSNGELHLDSSKTHALTRWLFAVAQIQKEYDQNVMRLQEFSDRFLKVVNAGEKNESFGVFTDRD